MEGFGAEPLQAPAPMFAVGLYTVAVKCERMVLEGKAQIAGHALLALLDFGIDEFLDPTALQADEVVVVLALVEFKQGSSRLEIGPLQDAGLLELHQHPIHCRESDIAVVGQQLAVDVLGAHVPHASLLENLEDFQAGHGGFEAKAFEFRWRH